VRKALYFLGILDDADVAWLMRSGTRKTVPSGTVLIEEGKPTDYLYFVLDGAFTVSTRNAASLATLKAGEIVGEISFVDSRPPTATVRADAESIVGAVPRGALTGKLRDDLGFAARFYRSLAVFLADRLRATTGTLGGGRLALDENIEDEDELATHLLDGISMAGFRFASMQRGEWGGRAVEARRI
jgi:CRP/FNR family transcriptional regulator, cyclic AMP receptor protein